MQKTETDPVQIARMMIEHHGLRAGAVAQERAHEAELSADTQGLDRWRSVQTAIAELRSTAPERRRA